MATTFKPAKMKDVTLFWASLRQPNPMSGKYQTDLCQLSEKTVEKLTEMGVDVSNKGDDRGFFVTCKSQYPIDAYNADGSPVTVNVANGSVGDVVVTPYSWSFRNKKGVSLGISKIIVTDLIEYASEDNMDDEDLEEL